MNSVSIAREGPGPSRMSAIRPRIKTKMSDAILTVVMITEKEVPIVREIRFRVETVRTAMTAVSCGGGLAVVSCYTWCEAKDAGIVGELRYADEVD